MENIMDGHITRKTAGFTYSNFGSAGSTSTVSPFGLTVAATGCLEELDEMVLPACVAAMVNHVARGFWK